MQEKIPSLSYLQQNGYGNLSEELNVPMFSGEWNRTAVADTDARLLHLGHSTARVSKPSVMTSDTQETQLALGSK